MAIRAVAKALERGLDVEFCLLGKGPFEPELRRVARAAGIHDRIRWISQLPQQELFALYHTMHCFLFPSLHDSSGNVVLEAQANGLPVICLDLGGPATLVNRATAIVVDTRGQSEEGVVNSLAKAIEKLAWDELGRAEMGSAAMASVSETMTWENRVSGALALVKTCIT